MASASHGRFVWYEHLTRDVPSAIAFYRDVIGWNTQPFGEGSDYLMWVGSQGPLGGVMQLPDELARVGVPPHWMAHVLVDDLGAAVAAVKRLGGTVNKEPTEIPTVGRFAVTSDPQGAVLSMFQPNGSMTAHDPSKDGEFCWSELLTSDAEAGFRFYSELFGWKLLEEMDMGAMGKYRVFGAGEPPSGGMMKLPPGAPMPPMWMFYVSTSDLEAATDRATGRGGKILNGPVPVPGGRIVQLIDPQGAMFALHQATSSR